MPVKVPIYGLLYSEDGNTYSDPPIPPDTMSIEVEQVTADTYRTVDLNAYEYTDFLAVKLKISCTWSTMTPSEFSFLSQLFYKNKYIYLKFANPQNPETFISYQFKCNNLKFAYTLVDKTTGKVKEISDISQSYTQR